MSAYTSSKQFELGSTAFRQWKADHSHCKFIHGYQLKTELTFGCNTLDDKNWCVDFGGLDILKQTLRNHFDHTLVAAGDDPELTTFQDLDSKGVIQLVIMNEGVGVEKFAEFVFKTADTFVDEASEGRCFVKCAKVIEHADNWAEYTGPEYTGPIDTDTTFAYDEETNTLIKSKTQEEQTQEEQTQEEQTQEAQPEQPQPEQPQPEQPQPEQPQPAPEPRPGTAGRRGARVGGNVTPGKGNWFAGTTWGN